MTTTLNTQDQSLRENLLKQLAWHPELDATMVAVSAHDGIVTLTGYVDTYAAKLAAERIVRGIYGVKAVANELDVKLAQERIDPDIASDAVQALKSHINVPSGILVTVRNGRISLSGTVEWMFQKVAAERAVKHLRGVRGVDNQIAVKPTVSPRDVQKRIVEALHRHADIDARRINVETDGSKVILSGSVRSFIERDEAGRAAWAGHGVALVANLITVAP
jgi:osmotically-inducible protein OsmY